MSAVGKRRRSPRLSKSPPPKRKKLERIDTIEMEEPFQDSEVKKKVIDRKTTSFLEEMDKNDKMAGVVASLSISNQEKLKRSLSSIINPTENTEDPEPILIARMEGFDERFSFTKRFNDAGPCWLELPFDFLLQLISLLPAQEAWIFGRLCRYTMVLVTSFSSHLNLPIGERSAKSSKNVNIPGFNITKYEGYNVWDNKEKEEGHRFKDTNLFKSFSRNVEWGRPERGLLLQRSCVSQPEGLSLQLYDYQAQGLTWMLAIEKIARKQQPIVFSSLLSIPGCPNLIVDAKDDNLPFTFTENPYNQEKYQYSFTTQGGIFADEMGLGKTISMIALIISNPRLPKVDGTFIPCPTPTGNTPAIYESKATLLLCPSALVDQWESEIRSHTSLTCYSISTAAQHRKVKYSTVMEADVVIVSSKFLLSNPSYQGLWDNRNRAETEVAQSARLAGGEGSGRRSSRRAASKKELVNPEPFHVSPLFHLIAWHRIILDEAHEMVQIHNLSRFRSNYRWYVTGTPFPDRDRYNQALTFLSNDIANDAGEKRNKIYNLLQRRAIKNSIFWRNTKLSVGVQVEIPPVIERIQIVYLSPIEQALYDSISAGQSYSPYRQDQYTRQVVSDPQYLCQQVGICDFKDPMLPQKYINYYNKLIQRSRERIVFLKTDTARYQSNIISCEEDIMKHICKRACFTRLLSEPEEKCDNCCEISSSLMKIPCKHKLCLTCLKEITDSSEKVCTKCNTSFDVSGVTMADDQKRTVLDQDTLFSVPEACDELSQEMRSLYGTKMAATVSFVVKIMKESDAKMIIFSQYEASLNHLISILQELDPVMFKDAIVQLKGNPHVRKKRLDRFNSSGDDAARVITMSLQNSASGTHLAAASHVLLLDPVIGSAGDALATDAQAIARAHRLGQSEPVQAIRFIVARTIDQTDYEKAYGAIVHQKRGLGPKSARKA